MYPETIFIDDLNVERVGSPVIFAKMLNVLQDVGNHSLDVLPAELTSGPVLAVSTVHMIF